MKRSLGCFAVALACLATMSWAATGPFVQVVSPSSSLANTCTAGPSMSTVLANVDLPAGASYRYVVAFRVVPDPSMDMDMMMMMMMMGGGTPDPYYALLYQSPPINGPALAAGASLNLGAPAQWYTMVAAVADHTTIMAQVTTFTGANGSGAVAAVSALSWDCTTGQLLATSNAGNANGAILPPAPGFIEVIEYYNAGADHYFLTSAGPEIAALDAGQIAGWVRTGNSFSAYTFAGADPAASPVCRIYLPPVYGDSHFFSASPAECAYVQAVMPAAVLESANAFYIDTPDTTTGACPSGTIAVYRLWNHRADLDHRYTTSATIKSAMIAQGYVAEGYGSDQVTMCSPQTWDYSAASAAN